MLIDLYGLTIHVVDADGDQTGADADLRWYRKEAEALADQSDSSVAEVEETDGRWTHHVFATHGRTSCAFAISPDGRTIYSNALPKILESDLMGLFAEPVMRTIFRRLGILAFHGAALRRGARSILLVGAKGAGKSTAAAALMKNGWAVMTDDLTRIVQRDRRWCVTSGYRQLKLSEETVTSMGYDAQSLQRRWSGPRASAAPPAINKAVLRWDQGDAPRDAPTLEAIYVLAPRERGLASPRRAPMSVIDRFRALVEHTSDDPADPDALPPRELIATIGSILERVDVQSLTMPDNLAGVVSAVAHL